MCFVMEVVLIMFFLVLCLFVMLVFGSSSRVCNDDAFVFCGAGAL